jgi:hypothetical protein
VAQGVGSKFNPQYHLKKGAGPVKIAIIKNITNNKCWRGCGGKGALMHCWWGMQAGATILKKNLEAS